jgi:hypothetical protein
VNEAVGFGLSRCELQIASEWHTRATPHNVTSLRSSVGGTARIVWRETLTAAELADVRAGTLVEKWAIVDIGSLDSGRRQGYVLEPLNEAILDADGQLVPGVARLAVYQSTDRIDELDALAKPWVRAGQLTASTLSIGGVAGATRGTLAQVALSPDGRQWQYTFLDCGPIGNEEYSVDDILDLTINDDDEVYQ